jgi:hypothetical protein
MLNCILSLSLISLPQNSVAGQTTKNSRFETPPRYTSNPLSDHHSKSVKPARAAKQSGTLAGSPAKDGKAQESLPPALRRSSKIILSRRGSGILQKEDSVSAVPAPTTSETKVPRPRESIRKSLILMKQEIDSKIAPGEHIMEIKVKEPKASPSILSGPASFLSNFLFPASAFATSPAAVPVPVPAVAPASTTATTQPAALIAAIAAASAPAPVVKAVVPATVVTAQPAALIAAVAAASAAAPVVSAQPAALIAAVAAASTTAPSTISTAVPAVSGVVPAVAAASTAVPAVSGVVPAVAAASPVKAVVPAVATASAAAPAVSGVVPAVAAASTAVPAVSGVVPAVATVSAAVPAVKAVVPAVAAASPVKAVVPAVATLSAAALVAKAISADPVTAVGDGSPAKAPKKRESIRASLLMIKQEIDPKVAPGEHIMEIKVKEPKPAVVAAAITVPAAEPVVVKKRESIRASLLMIKQEIDPKVAPGEHIMEIKVKEPKPAVVAAAITVPAAEPVVVKKRESIRASLLMIKQEIDPKVAPGEHIMEIKVKEPKPAVVVPVSTPVIPSSLEVKGGLPVPAENVSPFSSLVMMENPLSTSRKEGSEKSGSPRTGSPKTVPSVDTSSTAESSGVLGWIRKQIL